MLAIVTVAFLMASSFFMVVLLFQPHSAWHWVNSSPALVMRDACACPAEVTSAVFGAGRDVAGGLSSGVAVARSCAVTSAIASSISDGRSWHHLSLPIFVGQAQKS